MMKYKFIIGTMLAEIAIFLFFRGDYGKYFQQVIPIIIIAEITPLVEISKIFIFIGENFKEQLIKIRLLYVPYTIGGFGFIAIGQAALHHFKVRQQVDVGHHHRLRLDGAARRKLQGSRLGGVHRRLPPVAGGRFLQVSSLDYPAQGFNAHNGWPQESLDTAFGNQKSSSHFAEHAADAHKVLIQLAQPEGRVERDRDAAGELDPQESVKELN